MLFLETMRNAEALRRFALAAAERGKPVIAYKLGRSAAARELAVSHTGALAGEDDVADVFLAACGIARVDTLDGLIEGLPLLARVPAAQRARARATRRRGHHDRRRRHHGDRSAGERAASRSSRRARRHLRALAAAGIEVKPARLVDLTIAGARYDAMKADARHSARRAGVRSRARGRRLVGARPSGA